MRVACSLTLPRLPQVFDVSWVKRVLHAIHGHEFVRKWGGCGDEPGRFDHPWGIHAHGGLLYVSDRSRVQVFDVHGGLVDIHHVSGAGDLTGVSVGDAGDVWAADGTPRVRAPAEPEGERRAGRRRASTRGARRVEV